jgi:hypothetical protein
VFQLNKQLAKLASNKVRKTTMVKKYVMSAKNGKTTAAKLGKESKGKKTWAVRVDTRMKKDKQGQRRGEWRKKHGTRKK